MGNTTQTLAGRIAEYIREATDRKPIEFRAIDGETTQVTLTESYPARPRQDTRDVLCDSLLSDMFGRDYGFDHECDGDTHELTFTATLDVDGMAVVVNALRGVAA